MAKKETVEKTVVETGETRDSGIIVRDTETFRPKVLPLIVVLPEGASKAQIERAKVLNGFAYQFPDKWAARKEVLLAELEALKDAPDPVENPNAPKLTVGTPVPGVN